MRGDRLHKYTKKATVIILVAAVILALIITGFAASFGREFIVNVFRDHSVYSVTDKKGSKTRASELIVGYIPEGFSLTKEDDGKIGKVKQYEKDSYYIYIEKGILTGTYSYHTDTNGETVEVNGTEYVFRNDEEYGILGYIWNNGEYVFEIEGNLSKEEILKIAESIE